MSIHRPAGLRTTVSLASLAALLGAGAAAAAASPRAHERAGAATVRVGTVVKLRATSFGKVLVDARGRTLYLYTPDSKGTSACYGACAAAWPPLLTTARPRGLGGARSSLLGVTRRKDGRRQVTYAGHPLYRFASDAKAGETNGEGLQGVWWVVSAAGVEVTKKAAARSAAATVQLRTTSLGPVLVDDRGHTVYLYTPDTSGSSTCYGQCAASWPPLLASGTLSVGKGLKRSLLGTTRRSDGRRQVTYAGHPLYLFASDDKSGQTRGEGLGGRWYALDAHGAKVEDSSHTSTTPEPGSGGGY
jgi:predicted lipoprotein with Yx(FWY)xxD motif